MSRPPASRLGLVLDVSAVPPSPAGAGRYIAELAGALSRRDEVGLTLVTRWDDTERWQSLRPDLRLIATVPASRPARLAYERVWLGRRLRREPPETLEVYHGPHYTLPAGLPSGRVVTVHDLTFLDHPEWHETAKVRFFQSAIRRSAREADVMVCVSGTTAARLADLVEVAGDVVVAEHGVDHERFRPGPVDRALLPEGLPAEGELVVHIGTLEPRKGVVDLGRAFETVAARRPLARLVLAGLPGWAADEVEAAVATSQAAGRIHRLGWVPDETVVALMRAARVVAYPSYEEGFGLPALEAMAVGAPLITTEGTAMAEFAGEAAWLVPPGDPGSLARALDTVLEAPAEQLARRVEEGTGRAARFTWERTAAVHLEAYELARTRARRRSGT